ncbi:oxidoreductase, FAD/FMN-binding protein [Ditylenchus destructor]|uniref:Oxidoreductase, FAD/FMN-binding protein n=1 Tax=Ditylenchus destructor TaxID=166010 RepID=A0AAD4R0P0_9BILA|nr:oxidoreductase, FAD/FMN-binding protein [Ditylenchus destructor]
MVKAIEDGVTDAIGLGRPSTTEIDLPAKILKDGVQSAKLNLSENDLKVSGAIYSFQMWQAQQTPYKEGVDLNEGLLDVSDPEVVTEFKNGFSKFIENIDVHLEKSNGRPLLFVDSLIENLPESLVLKAQA